MARFSESMPIGFMKIIYPPNKIKPPVKKTAEATSIQNNALKVVKKERV